jgi:tripartite-type tricarboxylate transporter receptor subunit TctC
VTHLARRARFLSPRLVLSPRLALSLSLLVGATAQAMAADADDNFYKGKQIEIVVGSTPGDAYDFYARIVARYMGKYIPGNPTFVVKNMPGAGGLTVSNYMFNTAPRDGTVISAPTQSIPTAALLLPSGVRYDPTKFSWIGSISKDVFVAYVWNTSPVTDLEYLKTKEGTFGANGIGSAGIDFPLLVREILGLKLKLIPGYSGQPEVKVAMERGEIDGSFGNGWGALNATQPTWVPEGKVRLLAQFGFERNPDIPANVPVILDLVKNEADRQALQLVTARQEFSKPYVAPPEVPAARLAMLRTAFDAAIADSEFDQERKKAGLTMYGPMKGADLAALTVKLSQTPTPVVERISAIFKSFETRK